MSANPFTVRGTIQNPRDFIGRKTELLHIVTRLKTMQSCSVVGERRIGKSSLLYHLFQTGNERLSDSGFRFVYIELTDASAQTVVDFLQTVLQSLDLPTDSIKDDNKPNRNLTAFGRAIQGLVDKGERVILCLDEFEGLFDNPQEFNDMFFNHFRSMVNHRKLALVTASRQPLEVYSIENKLTSPFFNLLSVTELTDFTSEEVETFLAIYQQKVSFTDHELEFIYWYHQQHPIKLQIFCDLMFQWRDRDWSNDMMLEETARVYSQFLGGRHDWRKWSKNTIRVLSGESFSKWLLSIKSFRDLLLGA